MLSSFHCTSISQAQIFLLFSFLPFRPHPTFFTASENIIGELGAMVETSRLFSKMLKIKSRKNDKIVLLFVVFFFFLFYQKVRVNDFHFNFHFLYAKGETKKAYFAKVISFRKFHSD